MPATYESIATTTVGTATSTVTFSSISGSYTDLVIVYDGTVSANASMLIRFNGDTGLNYSITHMGGNGTTASSGRISNSEWINTTSDFLSGMGNAIINIMNYSNTTTNKTALIRTNDAARFVKAAVGLWRSTAAITSVSLIVSGANWQTGSNFTLYGIKAA